MSPRLRRYIPAAIGLPAVVGQVLFLTRPDDLLAAALWIVVPNAAAGAFIALMSPLFERMFTGRSRDVDKRTAAGYRMLADGGLVLVPQLVTGLLALLTVVGRVLDDGTYLLAPIGFVVIAAVAVFAGILLGVLVVWPVRILVETAVLAAAGGVVDVLRPLVAAVILLLTSFVATLLLAAPIVWVDRYILAALVQLLAVLFDFRSGGDVNQGYAWAARVLLVASIAAAVMIARENGRREAARRADRAGKRKAAKAKRDAARLP